MLHGDTPLMATINPPLYTGVDEESRLKNIAALLAAGSNINARNKEGQTVLDLGHCPQDGPFGDKDIQEVIALLTKHQTKTKGEQIATSLPPPANSGAATKPSSRNHIKECTCNGVRLALRRKRQFAHL